jgi:hypothetical protein
MKKLLLYFTIHLFTLWVSANPVYRPGVFLEALSFDADGHWKITLTVNQLPDSVRISSSSGQSFYTSQAYDFWTLTGDSVKPYLYIDPDGDSVTIVSFYMSWESFPDSLTETIVFGDFPGSVIPKPLEGQSIVRLFPDIEGSDYHCLRSASGSVAGTLHGRIFDKENNPVSAGYFCLSPFPVKVVCADNSYVPDGFEVHGEGTYSASMYALLYEINTIQLCTPYISGAGCYTYLITGSLKIDSLQFAMFPDSSVELDIHMLEDFEGVREQTDPDPILKICPNPATQGTFHYEIGIPVKSAKCFFMLFDAGGHQVWAHPVTGNSGDIELPSGISDGLYFLQVKWKGRSLTSAPLVIKK